MDTKCNKKAGWKANAHLANGQPKTANMLTTNTNQQDNKC